MKKLTITAAVLLSSLLLFTGCGAEYDFSDHELTHAVGVDRDVIDELDKQPDDNGDSGNADIEAAKNMTSTDFYTYWFPHSGSEDVYDVVEIDFTRGKVCYVSVAVYGDGSSEYSVLGIKVGDSRDSAMTKGENHFGESGSALSDDEERWSMMSGERDTVTFGDASDKNGWLNIYIDTETDTVSSLEYSRY